MEAFVDLLCDVVARGEKDRNNFTSLAPTMSLIVRAMMRCEETGNTKSPQVFKDKHASLLADAERQLKEFPLSLTQEKIEKALTMTLDHLRSYLKSSQKWRDQSEYDSDLLGIDEILSVAWMMHRYQRGPIELAKVVAQARKAVLAMKRNRFVDNFAADQFQRFADIVEGDISIFGLWREVTTRAENAQK